MKNTGPDSFPACLSAVPCGGYTAGYLNSEELTDKSSIILWSISSQIDKMTIYNLHTHQILVVQAPKTRLFL